MSSEIVKAYWTVQVQTGLMAVGLVIVGVAISLIVDKIRRRINKWVKCQKENMKELDV